jgi:HK97 family phage prohead protease
MSVVHKVTLSPDADGRTFVLSDTSEDNYLDVVGDSTHPELGWNLETFKKNPIALWSHDSKDPIGKWIKPRIENGALKAELVLAPVGVSPRIDELRSLIDCGILRGVSVGFIPTRSQELPSGGVHWQRMTLVEASLCSVPANPSALLRAKKLGVGTDLIRKVFKQGVSFANAEAIARSRQPRLLSASPEALQRVAERAAKDAYNRASLAKARAMIAKSKSRAEEAQRTAKDAFARAAKDAANLATHERVKAEAAERAAKAAYNRAVLARAKERLAKSKQRTTNYKRIDPDDYNTEDGFMHDCIEDLLRQGGYDDRLEASKACKVRWDDNE